MKKYTPFKSMVNPLALAFMMGVAYLPFVHAEQSALSQLYNAITYEDVTKAKATLAAGVDWTKDGKVTDYQWASLHFAVRHTSSNGTEILKLILTSNTNVNARAQWGDTPLHFAAELGNTNAFKLLIEKNADVNSKGMELKTPLHLATAKGHLEVVKLLVEGCALINAKDRYKNTPLMCAVVAKRKDVEVFLRQRGAKAK